MSEHPPPPPPGGRRVPPAEFPSTPPLAPPPPPVPPGATGAVGSWPERPDDIEVPDRRVSVWVMAAGIVAVMALLGAAFALFIGDDDGDLQGAGDEQPTSTTAGEPVTPTAPPATTAPPTELQGVVDEIEAFVAAERGLPFLRDVTVELADDEAFQARLLEDFEEDVADIAVAGQVLQALGLVEPGTDLVAAQRALLEGAVVGFYDPETDELVVRGTSASPYVRAVMAHELTHALDDQHFELDRPQLEEADDESAFGFTALLEGNAVRVEDAYRATFTDDEEALAIEEEAALAAGIDLGAIPLALAEALIVPYILGPDLIEAILDAGGQARLDASFASPPTTSEALLDPPTFIEGQGALPVSPPVADGAEIERGAFGSIGLAQILGELTLVVSGLGGLADEVEGWGGDEFVAWVDGDRVCVRANIVGDTADDTAEIAEALGSWADDPPGGVEATVATADVVTLTSCG